MSDSELLRGHLPCPHCGSSDAAAEYDDGHWYCFSCGKIWGGNSYERKGIEQMIAMEDKGRIREITDRCISEETCKKFGVRTLKTNGKIVKHYYPYYNKKGEQKAEKVRTVEGKNFIWTGEKIDLQLFGAQCQPTTGRFVVVCEGEIDALSMYQVLGGRYTVISLPDGCRSFKALKDNYQYLDKFENIILCLDGDKPGREAVERAVQYLPHKKVKLMKFSEDLKDPNEMLMQGKTQELLNLFWRAEEYRPEDIINIGDMFERLSDYRKTHNYTPTPWAGLTDMIQGTRPGQLVIMAAGCVTADTEFFNGKRWKPISEYTEGDLVLQYDQDTGKASLTKPLEYVKKPCDWVYRFKTKYRLDMALSPEHNVLYKSEYTGALFKMSAQEVAEQGPKFRGRIPVAFKYAGKGIDMSEVEIRLQVAVIADGSINKPFNKSVTFHIKKEYKKERLKKLLDQYGKNYNWYERKDGYIDVTFRPPRVEKYFKEFWYDASEEQLKIIVDEVFEWDGNNLNAFYTSNKDSADFIQFACVSLGKHASLLVQDRRGQMRGKYVRKSLEYTVHVSDRPFIGMRRYKGPEQIPTPDGFKYCFSVPKTNLVLRYNNQVFCTGNTGQGKSIFLRSWMYYLMQTTQFSVGALYLEENPEETVISLMSIAAGKNLKKNAVWDSCTDEELKEYFNSCNVNRRIELFDPLSNTEPDYICSKIRYLAVARGCQYIFLDHITYLADDAEDPRRCLNKLIKNLHDLCVELGIVIIAACHLRKSPNSNKTHEEGGRVTLDDLKDSSSIKQLSDVIIGLERNGQDEDQEKANTTLLRVLKNRDFGLKGPATALYYDKDTTRLTEVGFEETSEQPFEGL